MFNNLKLLKNIFSLFFAFLILGIIIRYNENLFLGTLTYLNIDELTIKNIKESATIPLFASLSMIINGLLLFLVGFKINKLEKEITL